MRNIIFSHFPTSIEALGLVLKTKVRRLLLPICSSVLLIFSPHAFSAELSVHTQISKFKVADITADTQFEKLSDEGRWQIVRFYEPIIPVWVSEEYIERQANTGIVTANRLNMRLSPRKNAPILASVARGYRSKILGTENEFVQIYAPTWLRFSIHKDSISNTLSSLSGSNKEPVLIRDVEPVENAKPVNESSKSVGAGVSKDSAEGTWETARTGSVESEDSTGQAIAKRPEIDSAENRQDPSSIPRASAQDKSAMDSTQSLKTEQQAMAATKAVSSSELQHRLAPGDTISLIVFGEADLSATNLRIPQSGVVSFPLIGGVSVAGRTTTQVESIVRDRLSGGFVRNPRLTVSIDQYRPIFILGEVVQIGSFPYSEGLTVAKALATAGGAKNSALANGVSISREGEVVMKGLSLDSQFPVLSGDIISVSEEAGVAGEAAFYVYLHGEVARPGEYEFRRGLTVEKAVVLAGGFTLRASRRKIAITRIVEEGQPPEKIKKVALHTPVEPGDIIDVGASWF